METDEIIRKEYFNAKRTKVSYLEGKKIAVVEATSNYITIDEFKEVFGKIEQLVLEQGISKLIFDKRKLTVFISPAWSGTLPSGRSKCMTRVSNTIGRFYRTITFFEAVCAWAEKR